MNFPKTKQEGKTFIGKLIVAVWKFYIYLKLDISQLDSQKFTNQITEVLIYNYKNIFG